MLLIELRMDLPRGARKFLGDRKPRPKLRSAIFRFVFGEKQDNGPKCATLATTSRRHIRGSGWRQSNTGWHAVI